MYNNGIFWWLLYHSQRDKARKEAAERQNRARVEYSAPLVPGDLVTWTHPSGAEVPAEVVAVDSRTVRIRVMHYGQPEELWVLPTTLRTCRPQQTPQQPIGVVPATVGTLVTWKRRTRALVLEVHPSGTVAKIRPVGKANEMWVDTRHLS